MSPFLPAKELAFHDIRWDRASLFVLCRFGLHFHVRLQAAVNWFEELRRLVPAEGK
jgi:hypothetical protein